MIDSYLIRIGLAFIITYPLALLFGYLYRQRGTHPDKKDAWTFGKKALPIFAMSLLSYGLTATTTYIVHPEAGWLIYTIQFIIEIAAWFLLCMPSWGEIFPYERNTLKEKFPKFVVPVANFIAGHVPAVPSNDQQIFWKISAWMPRIGIYGILIVLNKAYSGLSLQPLLLWVFASIYVGFIYRRCYFVYGEENWIEKAETRIGAYLAIVIALLTIP